MKTNNALIGMNDQSKTIISNVYSVSNEHTIGHFYLLILNRPENMSTN